MAGATISAPHHRSSDVAHDTERPVARPTAPAHENAQRPVLTPNSMPTHYSIEEADLSIAASVIQSLWVNSLVGHDTHSAREKMRHGYLENPAGRGTVILLKADGLPEAQGAQGLHPRLFHHGERSVPAIGLADYVVNAEHRSLAPALMLMRRGAQTSRTHEREVDGRDDRGDRFVRADVARGLFTADVLLACAEGKAQRRFAA